MKQQYFGQIDLTKLGNIVRQHPELVKEVNFKDGSHKLIKHRRSRQQLTGLTEFTK